MIDPRFRDELMKLCASGLEKIQSNAASSVLAKVVSFMTHLIQTLCLKLRILKQVILNNNEIKAIKWTLK
jgi:hypothetical protein